MRQRATLIVLLVFTSLIMTCSEPGEDDSASAKNTVTDVDGNVYTTVQIGDQEWMVENLRVTHYRDGTPIPNVIENTGWTALTTAAYGIYNNNASNEVDTYGALYNWWAVVDSRNIAPESWHIPTDAEWRILIDHLGGEEVAGGKMKRSGTSQWASPNTMATNESGFNGVPAGYRSATDGTDGYMGYVTYFWTATESDNSAAWARRLGYSGSAVQQGYSNKKLGYSIRCVKD